MDGPYSPDDSTFFIFHHELAMSLANFRMEVQADCFAIATSLNALDVAKRHHILSIVANLVKSMYPSACLIPYGAFIQGVGGKFSKLEIHCDPFGKSPVHFSCSIICCYLKYSLPYIAN